MNCLKFNCVSGGGAGGPISAAEGAAGHDMDELIGQLEAEAAEDAEDAVEAAVNDNNLAVGDGDDAVANQAVLGKLGRGCPDDEWEEVSEQADVDYILMHCYAGALDTLSSLWEYSTAPVMTKESTLDMLGDNTMIVVNKPYIIRVPVAQQAALFTALAEKLDSVAQCEDDSHLAKSSFTVSSTVLSQSLIAVGCHVVPVEGYNMKEPLLPAVARIERVLASCPAQHRVPGRMVALDIGRTDQHDTNGGIALPTLRFQRPTREFAGDAQLGADSFLNMPPSHGTLGCLSYEFIPGFNPLSYWRAGSVTFKPVGNAAESPVVSVKAYSKTHHWVQSQSKALLKTTPIPTTLGGANARMLNVASLAVAMGDMPQSALQPRIELRVELGEQYEPDAILGQIKVKCGGMLTRAGLSEALTNVVHFYRGDDCNLEVAYRYVQPQEVICYALACLDTWDTMCKTTSVDSTTPFNKTSFPELMMVLLCASSLVGHFPVVWSNRAKHLLREYNTASYPHVREVFLLLCERAAEMYNTVLGVVHENDDEAAAVGQPAPVPDVDEPDVDGGDGGDYGGGYDHGDDNGGDNKDGVENEGDDGFLFHFPAGSFTMDDILDTDAMQDYVANWEKNEGMMTVRNRDGYRLFEARHANGGVLACCFTKREVMGAFVRSYPRLRPATYTDGEWILALGEVAETALVATHDTLTQAEKNIIQEMIEQGRWHYQPMESAAAHKLKHSNPMRRLKFPQLLMRGGGGTGRRTRLGPCTKYEVAVRAFCTMLRGRPHPHLWHDVFRRAPEFAADDSEDEEHNEQENLDE